jgi:AP-3 complex subunit delta-1
MTSIYDVLIVKYLGLLGLHKLMRAHPRVVAEHKDLILDCLKDDDVTIRQRALDLITSMVSKRNLTGIVRRLIDHLETSDGSYRYAYRPFVSSRP